MRITLLIVLLISFLGNANASENKFSDSNAFLGIFIDQDFAGKGVRIDSTIPNSPAEIYGLENNQIIVKIDDVKIKNENHLKEILTKYNANDTINVLINDDDQQKSYRIKLMSRLAFEKLQVIESLNHKTIFAKMKKINPQLLEFFEVKNGVLVLEVESDKKSKLRAGDILTKIEGKEINSIVDVQNVLNSKKVGSDVILDLKRKEKEMQISVTIEEESYLNSYYFELDLENNNFILGSNSENAKVIDLNKVSDWFEKFVSDNTRKEIKSQIDSLELELKKIKSRIDKIN